MPEFAKAIFICVRKSPVDYTNVELSGILPDQLSVMP